MLSLLVTLLIAVLIVGLLFWILSLLPLAQPWMNIARAVLALIVVIWLISYLAPGLGGGLHVTR